VTASDDFGEVRFCSRCGAAMELRDMAGRARPTCPRCGFVHFADPKVAAGVAVVADGRLLLVRRAFPPERGRWALPAGFVDAGEDPRVTAVREAMEETGLVVVLDELVEVYPPTGPTAPIVVVFTATVTGGELSAADDADDAGYFPLDALPPIADFPSTRDVVARLQNRHGAGQAQAGSGQ